MQVYGLLMNPEPNDPLDSVLAEQWLTDNAAYQDSARAHTRKHACDKSLEAWKQHLCGEADRDIPKEFECPLSHELMNDPVQCKQGHTFDRDPIVTWLSHQKRECPLCREPLSPEDLVPNRALKDCIDSFKAKVVEEG